MLPEATIGEPPTVPSNLHVAWPEYLAEDYAAVLRPLRAGVPSGAHAPEGKSFAARYGEYAGAPYVLPVNSGTAALYLGLVGAGVKPGDEVITSAYGFTATGMAILQTGAVPVFVDVIEETGCLDPSQLGGALTEHTKAILPVHIDGGVADMGAILAFAQEHVLHVVQDAAQAHGATYHGTPLGALDTFGATAFSLSGSKNLAVGEGGILVTHNAELYEIARRTAIFGEDVPAPGTHDTRAFWSEGLGFQFRAPEVTWALAGSLLSRLDGYNHRANANAEILADVLGTLPGVRPPKVSDGGYGNFWKYRVRLVPEEWDWEGDPVEFRDRILCALKAEGVPCGLWGRRPIPDQPAYRRNNPYLPWSPNDVPEERRPIDRDAWPVTRGLLDTSVILGTERYPLYVQLAKVMELWGRAMQKIHMRRRDVFKADYTPFHTDPEPDFV